MIHTPSNALRGIAGLALAALVAGSAQAQEKKPLPLKYVGPATTSAITAGDLMTRLYKYADDSMMGRDVGTTYHHKAVAYIESELRRLGLKPGGTNGSFYQDFPIYTRSSDLGSTLSFNGNTLKFGIDFTVGGAVKPFTNVPVILVGSLLDPATVLDSAAIAGKVVLLTPTPVVMASDTAALRKRNELIRSPGYGANVRALAGTLARISVGGDSIPAALFAALGRPQPSLTPVTPSATGIMTISVTRSVADRMFGGPINSVAKGTVGPNLSTNARIVEGMAPAGRNVVAILEGSDPKLKGQYVAIGAHSDHVGFNPAPGVAPEHDSLRVFNMIGRPAGAEGGRNTTTEPITAAEWAKMNADIAELRKIYPARPDSIFNGADDDGTGSMSVLEIAEAFAKGSVKPKRSILFVWHAGEEKGMWGSGYFMDNPTVPRDSIIAQINIDMVGRGAASDITGQAKGPVNAAGITGSGPVIHGGDKYVQLVGSRRLSTELGDLVESVNKTKNHGFSFDYNIDADGHQQNIYCRSDHWSYGKWGVPVVFFTTGGHADYHQATDEPQYIRYDHMALLDKLIFDVTASVANLDHRVVVDKPKPDPKAVCRQ